MSFSYANPTSGPSAGGIGWFNFGTLSMNPGDVRTGLTGTLNNGNIVTFDLAFSLVSGQSRAFTAVPVPTYPGAQFGVIGYTGLSGNVAMYANQIPFNTGIYAFTVSNITVETPGGDAIPNFSVLIADAESTNLFEQFRGQTNGTPWNLFAALGAVNAPTLNGVGTQTFDIVGTQQFGPQQAYVLSTLSPSQIVITLTQLDTFITRQSFAIGFATTGIKLQKDIGQRIDASDQFVLDITGSPADQVTTTGGSTGIQTEFAQVFAVPGSTYNVSETMAPGSASVLGDYTLTVSAANATLAGSVPSIGPLPIAFTPALGDDVTYTLLNTVQEVATKTVDKAFADVGEVLTYTITVDNPNDFAVNNVLVTDATPVGTTYVGNLSVSAPYTGTDPATGITITTIPANGSVILSWQVQVNALPPIANPVPNYARVTIPGGTSGITNVVTTQVNMAYVTVNKLVDKAYAKPGDVLTYTLLLSNAGNVSASNVVLTDIVPAGTTLIPGSVTGATGTPPTLTITNPIPAGGSATVTFKVKINGIPAVNPIPNFASVAYSYTVDPASPNGKTGTRRSNTVTTLVSIATLTTTKAVDKSASYIGDIITYQLAVKNTGNIPANNVVLTDVLPAGVSYVAGSLIVNVPYSGTLAAGLALTTPIAPGQTVTLSFKAKVDAMPNPNPVINQATVSYAYTVDPRNTNGETGIVSSNKVCTLVFRYNYGQQISDLIESVALEQAALAAIANAEGAKIQKMVATGGVTPQELLCLNKSVSDMIDSIAMLEAVLKQKLGIVKCQITGCGEGCM